MEEVAWKCSAAFLLGAATHYLISHHLQSGESAPESSATPPPAPTATSKADAKANDGEASPHDGEDDEEFESDDDSEWEDMDEQEWQPHKMVLCVRTDLKMGKGTKL